MPCFNLAHTANDRWRDQSKKKKKDGETNVHEQLVKKHENKVQQKHKCNARLCVCVCLCELPVLPWQAHATDQSFIK